jgi:hypothetical protein
MDSLILAFSVLFYSILILKHYIYQVHHKQILLNIEILEAEKDRGRGSEE